MATPSALQREIAEAVEMANSSLVAEIAKLRNEVLRLTSIQGEDIVSLEEAAKKLNLSKKTLYNWVKEGRVKTVRKGAKIYFRKSEIYK